jgi:hypothetical protein
MFTQLQGFYPLQLGYEGEKPSGYIEPNVLNKNERKPSDELSSSYKKIYEDKINGVKNLYKDIYQSYYLTFNSFRVDGQQLIHEDLIELLKETFLELEKLYLNQEGLKLYYIGFREGGYSKGKDGKILQKHIHLHCFFPISLNFASYFNHVLSKKIQNKYNVDINEPAHIKPTYDLIKLSYDDKEDNGYKFNEKLEEDTINFEDYKKLEIIQKHRSAYQKFYCKCKSKFEKDKNSRKPNKYVKFFDPLYKSNQSNKVSMETLRELFISEFDKVLYSPAKNKNVFLIPAEVGVGKTTALNKIDESKLIGKTLILFPTHDIKSNVNIGVELPNLDKTIYSKIKHSFKVNKPFYEVLNDVEQKIYNDWKRKVKSLIRTNNVIRTTHQKYFYFDSDIKELFDTIIFDECFLNSYLQIESISGDDFRDLRKQFPSLNKLPRDQVLNASAVFNDPLIPFLMDHYKHSYVKYLFHCNYLLMEEDKILFLKNYINPFPENAKILILSATASHCAYEKIFGKRLKIIDLPKPKLKAKIFQFCGDSFTKSSLEKPNIKTRLDKIEEYFKEKSYEILSYKSSDSKTHFYNAVGTNNFKGLNLLVSGTPNPNMNSFKLQCAGLGFEPSKIFGYEKGGFKNFDSNGIPYRYKIISKDKQIQKHFLNQIESEIKQLVGRTRPYECESNVVVLSRFPHPDADVYTSLEVIKLHLPKEDKTEYEEIVLKNDADDLPNDEFISKENLKPKRNLLKTMIILIGSIFLF